MGGFVNPFKIGKTYSPENFIDRKEEYGYLVGAVESGNNVVVIAHTLRRTDYRRSPLPERLVFAYKESV